VATGTRARRHQGRHTRPPDDSWALDGSPATCRAACEASLKALGVEAIGLYQYHRPDPAVPYEESVGALEELRQEGKVQLVGISNADPDQIRLAASITPLAAVQNELSPRFRSSLPELELCTELGIAFLPWSPLGGNGQGLRTRRRARRLRPDRGAARRLAPAGLPGLAAGAVPVCVPIPGSSRPESIRDSAAAADLQLSPEELSGSAPPDAGQLRAQADRRCASCRRSPAGSRRSPGPRAR
jgi:aryl-alcohol dehydrogenase-like predicted oxidoreductase